MSFRIYKYIIILIAVLMLCSCVRTVYVPDDKNSNIDLIEQSMLQYCTEDTPIPVSSGVVDGVKVYDGKSALTTLEQWQAVYNSCALSHAILVNSIRDLQKK